MFGMETLLKTLPAMLKAAGVQISMQEVPASKEAFAPLGAAASLPGAKLMRIQGRLKDGSRFDGLLVANQSGTEIST
jgi:hypothetical protein